MSSVHGRKSESDALVTTCDVNASFFSPMSSSSAKGKAPVNGTDIPYELPWCVQMHLLGCAWLSLFCRVEKYRPHILDDVVGNVDTIDRLKVIAKDGNCPHIIISVSSSQLSPWQCLILP